MGNDRLVRTVPTAFCGHLVLDVNRARPGIDHGPDRSGDIERTTPTRVDIHQERHIDRRGNPPHVLQHVVHRRHAEIGQSVRCVGDAAAAQVYGAVTHAISHDRRIGIDHTDDLQWIFFAEGGAKTGTR